MIPDSFDTGGLEGANVIAFVASPILVRKVAVTVGVQHANPADLVWDAYRTTGSRRC